MSAFSQIKLQRVGDTWVMVVVFRSTTLDLWATRSKLMGTGNFEANEQQLSAVSARTKAIDW